MKKDKCDIYIHLSSEGKLEINFIEWKLKIGRNGGKIIRKENQSRTLLLKLTRIKYILAYIRFFTRHGVFSTYQNRFYSKSVQCVSSQSTGDDQPILLKCKLCNNSRETLYMKLRNKSMNELLYDKFFAWALGIFCTIILKWFLLKFDLIEICSTTVISY